MDHRDEGLVPSVHGAPKSSEPSSRWYREAHVFAAEGWIEVVEGAGISLSSHAVGVGERAPIIINSFKDKRPRQMTALHRG